MKRLHAVAEGHGEVEAIPNLLARVLAELGRDGRWLVNKHVSRLPRNQLVDESVHGPRRPPRPEGIDKAVGLARAARADALIVVVDADDDCPASFGPAATAQLSTRIPAAAVMAVREYEAWLLLSQRDVDLRRIRLKNPELVRDAKRALRRLVEGYTPTTHQLELTRKVDLRRLRRRSASFDKLVRDVERLTR